MTVLTSFIRPRRRSLVSSKLVLICAFSCQWAFAANYYVSPNGNDANPGTAAQPFRNVSKGVSTARAGDTIWLEDGTYGNEGRISDRTGGWYGYAAPVKISHAGSSGAWITLKARNKGRAILDCGTTTSTMGCDKYVSLLSGAAYWSFEDLVFTRGAFGGIGTDNGASNIRVKGCRFENIGYWDDPTQIGEDGIGFDKGSSNWWIEGNVFHDIGRTGTSILDHGIYAGGSNVTVINNIFYNITDGWAIQLSDGASNWTIANNTFAVPHTSQSGHIMMWDINNSITIRNNIFHNPGTYAIARYTSTVSGCWVDHNLVIGASSMMANTSGCSVSTNQMSGDPKFVNAGAFDFRVQSGGAGIDQGVAAGAALDIDGRSRPQGPAPDLGAYEFSQTSSAPVITNVIATSITTNSAVISWTTDKPATSFVEYGLSSYTNSTPVDASLLTVHAVAVSNLSAGSLYRFRVGSRDSGGSLSYSPDLTFTTLNIAAPTPTPTPTPTPPTSSTNLTSGLAALWDFTEGSGTSVSDSSGNGNTGSLSNATWRKDVCGGCISLNGTNSSINVKESASLQMTSSLSVSMWIAPGVSSTSDPRILSKNYSWDIKLNGAGRYPQFSGGGKYAVMNASLAQDRWQHLVMTFQAGTVRAYLNGNAVAMRENTFTGGETLALQQYGVRIGADSSNGNFFGGILDDVRIYNRPLSAAEVATLYSTTIHSSPIPRRR